MPLRVDLSILNQKGTPAFFSDIFANRPAAGFAGRVFISTDTGAIYEDTGSTWTLIADAGAGTTGTLQQVTTNGNTTTQGVNITAGGLSANTVNVNGDGAFTGGALSIKQYAAAPANVTGYNSISSQTSGHYFSASQGGSFKNFLFDPSSLTDVTLRSYTMPNASGTLAISSAALTNGSVVFAGTGGVLSESNATFFWDNTNKRLGIGNAAPGAPLDVHGTGTAAQFNGTGTNNAYLIFQNAGASKWRVGNLYNSGANSFEFVDAARSTNVMSLRSTGTYQEVYVNGYNTISNIASFSSSGNYAINPSLTLSIPSTTTFNSGASWSGMATSLLNTWGANNTIDQGAVMSGFIGVNRQSFSTTGLSITLNQGSNGIRAICGMQVLNQTGGTNAGTISHGASLLVQGVYPSGSANVTYTNYYGLLLNQLDEFGTVTFTNRWGIYQGGASDKNYFNGNILVKSTTDNGNALQVTGNSNITGNLGIGTTSPSTTLQVKVGTNNNIGFYTKTVNSTVMSDIETVNDAGSANTPLSINASALYLLTQNNIVQYISSSGNVLINTTTDSGYKLNVNGTATISSSLQVGSANYVESPISLNAAGVNSNGQTDIMQHITNTKYSSASGSGENNIAFGWSNHWAASFGAYKQGVNLTGFRFYGEQGYNTPVKILDITAYGLINSLPTYNNTSGSAANLGISATGEIFRSTSSLKYKTNVQDYTKGLKEVLKLRPVTYNGKNQIDNGKTFAGLIAEEVHELGLTEFVQYAEDGSPDALAYQNMVSILVKAIQELNEKLQRNNIN
jgi:Chaperone of endosialidase